MASFFMITISGPKSLILNIKLLILFPSSHMRQRNLEANQNYLLLRSKTKRGLAAKQLIPFYLL